VFKVPYDFSPTIMRFIYKINLMNIHPYMIFERNFSHFGLQAVCKILF